jgi:hypothetical protein
MKILAIKTTIKLIIGISIVFVNIKSLERGSKNIKRPCASHASKFSF